MTQTMQIQLFTHSIKIGSRLVNKKRHWKLLKLAHEKSFIMDADYFEKSLAENHN